MALVGIGNVRRNNANEVVSEDGMHAREWDLGHVASDTFFLTHRTRRAAMVLGHFFMLRDMASQTFGIVCGWVRNKWFVRIVTGHAS